MRLDVLIDTIYRLAVAGSVDAVDEHPENQSDEVHRNRIGKDSQTRNQPRRMDTSK